MTGVHKIIIRIPADFVDAPASLFVNAFHRWIQEQSVADHLLIDVADYAHVAGGPGTLLVCSQGNIHIDSGGLMYVRKQTFNGDNTFQQTLSRCIRTAIELAEQLERDPAITGHFKHRKGQLRILFNDRLTTPNTPETAAAVLPEVRSAVTTVFAGHRIDVTPVSNSPQQLLELLTTIWS